MGCGGSKEDVATGNNGELFRRKSTRSASHRSSQASSSSFDGTSVAVKDVVKEREPKAEDDVEVASDEKPVAVAVEEKKEEEAAAAAVVVKKDVAAADVAASTTTVVNEAALTENAQPPPVKAEDELPKSTMADEAPVVDEAKADEAKEAVVATNEGGKSVGQSTTEPMEANPVDEHKLEVAAPVLPESSSQEKTAGAADVASSK